MVTTSSRTTTGSPASKLARPSTNWLVPWPLDSFLTRRPFRGWPFWLETTVVAETSGSAPMVMPPTPLTGVPEAMISLTASKKRLPMSSEPSACRAVTRQSK